MSRSVKWGTGLAGLAAAALPLLSAVFVPLVTVPSSRAGVQPRVTAFEFYGEVSVLISLVPLVLFAFVYLTCFTGLAGRGLAWPAFAAAMSAAFVFAALAGFALVIWPIAMLPSALVCLVASGVVLISTVKRASAGARGSAPLPAP